MSIGYLCPCLRCPTCGNEKDDTPHPEDGLASCYRCNREWWAVSGPHMDGRHITSAEEDVEWRAHDDAVLAANL